MKSNGKIHNSRLCLLVLLASVFWFFIFYLHFAVLSSSTTDQSTHPASLPWTSTSPEQRLPHRVEPENPPSMLAIRSAENRSDPCAGRYIYVHDLPPRFNEDMLRDCRKLSLWTNMCKFTSNAGLGPPLDNIDGVFSNTGWYATNQFAVDVIFSNRMKQYKCLTKDSSIASAIFVPFYAGFDIARYLWGYNISVRDASSLDLVDWLMKRPEWSVMVGETIS
ncbi:Xyloglucan galactosyltransferase KATAMARI1 [Platanthera guangdongensis]|uniref:Xyloglucan galactosyltransferase KATAMARI1 n=1 Tax=Platanthera guangdongensis TaxID=2320717 RepID=A0ABR2MFJ6_9ASPA